MDQPSKVAAPRWALQQAAHVCRDKLHAEPRGLFLMNAVYCVRAGVVVGRVIVARPGSGIKLP